jgi:magnesium chelatase subunit H
MRRKPISPAADPPRDGVIPVKVVILTLDHHVSGAVDRAREQLADELPGLTLRLHAATNLPDPAHREACLEDLRTADIVFANMLFIDEHIRAVLPTLEARREDCDALVCAMSAGEVMKQTRMGRFRMDGDKKGLQLLKRLRGSKKDSSKQGGQAQLAMLRRLPKLLSFIPGTAQDLRAYFLVLSYWLSGSSDNLADLVRMLVDRYADGPRRALRGTLTVSPPRQYPEVGLYHPDLPERLTEDPSELPRPEGARATVGLLLLRSYVLAKDSAHYDGVIRALEARGLAVIPAFASGLDNRPAIERFFVDAKGRPIVDAVIGLTGFSLVGGPAFNDASAAEEMLTRLDVPYLAAQPLEFQSVAEWERSDMGLTPIEATIMVAIPELDGATGSMVFGGRESDGARRMVPLPGRADRLASRVERLVRLRQAPPSERRVAIVLFNFPPNAGATGTAAYLSVWASLHRTLSRLKAEGYAVDVPPSLEALKERVLAGNAQHFGTDANVLARVSVDDHVRRTPFLDEIEAQWGSAPGRILSDGASVFVLGARFGNVMVGIQPGFGVEGDPMKLLFAKSFAPTHAFAAFYRYLRDGFEADAILHFGTHGALEFMPGKQTALSGRCWPDRLIDDVPNIYLYAANNPSEGALAKRRVAATLISYLTPPVARSGLYRDLAELRENLGQLRRTPPDDPDRARLLPLVESQAEALELPKDLETLAVKLAEVEETLVPYGLHVLGEGMHPEAQREYLSAMAEDQVPPATIEALVDGASPKAALKAGRVARTAEHLALAESLAGAQRRLTENRELDGVLRALSGRFVRPAPGGDVLRNPEVLPTGRNLHGFDPFALPSTFALEDGRRQADKLLATHVEASGALPRSIAMVLWGADNLKSGGGPIGQALWLMGARPRLDSYGRLCGAELVPLEELGRPRVDALITLSGIFRDLLPLQTRMLAEAAYLCATADEPESMNFLRAHALAYQAEHGGDLEEASLRVFSNAEGAYGANVNQLVDAGTWEDEDELADAYAARKCFAYRRNGTSGPQRQLLDASLARIDLAYQNLESVELGVTTIDHYFDTLGGIGRAARKARADLGGSIDDVPVYIGDQTQSEGKVRTLSDQVALETRTRSLNPRWTEEMLRHGAEGVRNIEAQVTNTLGWSATTSQVDGWVYRELTKTYVLDEEMRRRMAELNPKASLKLANRLLEASERQYWEPDPEMLEALQQAGEDLEDALEGIPLERGAA